MVIKAYLVFFSDTGKQTVSTNLNKPLTKTPSHFYQSLYFLGLLPTS